MGLDPWDAVCLDEWVTTPVQLLSSGDGVQPGPGCWTLALASPWGHGRGRSEENDSEGETGGRRLLWEMPGRWVSLAEDQRAAPDAIAMSPTVVT